MTDIELAELRRMAEATLVAIQKPMPFRHIAAFTSACYPATILAVIADAERYRHWRDVMFRVDAAPRATADDVDALIDAERKRT